MDKNSCSQVDYVLVGGEKPRTNAALADGVHCKRVVRAGRGHFQCKIGSSGKDLLKRWLSRGLREVREAPCGNLS